jgi:lipoprotein-releasing system ATP-binding protein
MDHPEKTLLCAQDIFKSYLSGKELVDVLKGVNFTVKKGESIAITGRSGSGKSTLLHILATLERASKGSIFFEENQITAQNCCRIRSHKLGIIFQSFNLLEDFTVLENILMPARIARQNTGPKTAPYAKAQELLIELGIDHRAHFLTKNLSGGEKQRVAIARALINTPLLLFADEPTGNLDQKNALYIENLLLETCKKRELSLVLVTHDENFAKKCDRNLLLEEGILK